MAQLATFDTHKYIKELTASGFDEKQAEVIIKSILEGRDYDVSNLATKEQLTKVEARLEKQIVATKEQLIKTDNKLNILDSKIENTKQELKAEIALRISESQNKIVMYMLSLFSPIYIGVLVVLVRWFMNN